MLVQTPSSSWVMLGLNGLCKCLRATGVGFSGRRSAWEKKRASVCQSPDNHPQTSSLLWGWKPGVLVSCSNVIVTRVNISPTCYYDDTNFSEHCALAKDTFLDGPSVSSEGLGSWAPGQSCKLTLLEQECFLVATSLGQRQSELTFCKKSHIPHQTVSPSQVRKEHFRQRIHGASLWRVWTYPCQGVHFSRSKHQRGGV